MRTVFLLLIICTTIFLGFQVVFAEEACNEYVDGIINDMKQEKEFMQDPYTIPEKSIELHKKVVFVNYTGEAKIYDGHIYGMSSLHRQGDVIVDKNKKTHLKLWLGAGVLKMQCSGKVKLMGHGPEVTIDAKMDLIIMKLDIVPTGENSNPKINNFKIDDIKGLEVKVSGMGPLKFFLNAYINIIGTVFKNLIRHAIENKMKEFMGKKLKKYQIPENCINAAFRRSLNSK